MRIEIRSDHVLLDGYINVTQRESRELSSPKRPVRGGNYAKNIRKGASRQSECGLAF